MDLAVYRTHGVAGVSVIAAVTAQNSRRVLELQSLPARFVRRQLEAVWEQVEPKAVCIGLLPDAAAMRAVGSFLRGSRDDRPSSSIPLSGQAVATCFWVSAKCASCDGSYHLQPL